MTSSALHEVRVKDVPRLLLRLVREPLEAMKAPMRLSWQASILTQTLSAAISGAIAALISHNMIDVLVGILIFPVLAVMVGSILTLFLYYAFAGFASTFLEIRRLNSLVVIATLPFFVLHAASGVLPPLDLIGMAAAMILLTVGLVEQFSLDRRVVFKLLAGIFCAFFAVWSLVQIYLSSFK